MKVNAIVTVPSMTSGNPLIAEVVAISKWRKFFGMDYIKLTVYCQGIFSTGWRWSENWYSPSEINLPSCDE